MTDRNCKCDGVISNEGHARMLLAKYREYYDETQLDIERLQVVIEHLKAPLKQMESEIKLLVVTSGKSVSGHGVTVTYRSGYERPKWNDKALLGYGATHPEMMAFRSVTKVKANAAIKVE